MSWFKTGTVAVISGSPNLVFTGANLISNKAAIAGMGIQIEGSDKTIELASVDSDSTATLEANWPGSTDSGLSFKIVPIQGFQVDLAYTLTAMAAAIAMFTALPSAAADGDYLQFLGSTKVPTNRTAIQVATNLSNKMAEVTVASAANCNIGAALSPWVEISGTTGITSLNPSSGTMYPNAVREVRFSGALVLTNGSNLVLPGGANITTVAGDRAVFKSDGSTTPIWTCISYTRIASAPYTTASPAFSGTMAAVAANFSGLVQIGGTAGTGSALRVQHSTAVDAISVLKTSVVEYSIGVRSADSYLRIGIAGDTASGVIFYNSTPFFGPAADNAIDSGNASFRWRNEYVATFLGVGTTANGGATGVAKFEAKCGNSAVAVSGYATGSTNSFAAQLRVDDAGGTLLGLYYTSTQVGSIYIDSFNNLYWTSAVGVAIYNAPSGKYHQFRINNTPYVELSTVSISPATDNAISCGASGNRWTVVYAATGTINTSDERVKDWSIPQTDYRNKIKALWVGDVIMYDDKMKTTGARHSLAIRAQQAYSVLGGIGTVAPANENDLWGERSHELTHLALWGVKDLYVMVEGIQIAVENHDREIADLKQRVAELERKAA